MKPQHWVPVVAFLGVSIPLVLLLNALQLGGDFRVWIALAAGVGATAYAQTRLAKRQDQDQQP